MNITSVGRLLVSGLLFAVVGSGCHSPLQYVSPRVVGRVVDADTQQPIAGVQVQRKTPTRSSIEPARGAEMLRQTFAATTDAEGRFDLMSARDVMFFRRGKWSSVTLTFTQRGYQMHVATFTQSSSTNAPGSDSEPLVLAGDVSLRQQNRENPVKQP